MTKDELIDQLNEIRKLIEHVEKQRRDLYDLEISIRLMEDKIWRQIDELREGKQ